MKKKFLKRTAAFAVASLMAVGVITVLPKEYFPQLGTNVSAEETYSTKIKIKRIETVNDNITVNVDSIIDTNNNFINDGWFTMWYSVNDYNNILPEESTALIYTYGSNYVDDNGNIGEWGFSGMTTSTPFSGGGSTIYLANHSYDEYYFDLGYADRNADDYESTFVNCVKVYFDPKHTYIEDFVFDETGHWYACNGCGEKIDFAAHTEDDGTVTVEPTETTEGQKEYKCTVCGYTTRTEVVSKLEQVGGIEINSENFPDEVFRQYVSDNFDNDNNGLLSNEEIRQITQISLGNSGLQSLKGVEYFTALTHLSCDHNKLTSLDISNNTALEYLGCWNNQLVSLDVSNNTALTSLVCNINQLTSLDVSKNKALAYLDCDDNQLVSLDVRNNTLLKTLFCMNNQLTSLDVSNNLFLTPTRFSYGGNSYNIGETCGAYDLANLPAGFYVTKASNWQNAAVTGDKLTSISGTVSYDYDCGNNHTATFNLTYTPVEHSYDEGVVTIEPTEQSEGEKTYTCTNCGATKTEIIARLGDSSNPSEPSQPSNPSEPSNPSTPSQPSEPSDSSQSEKNEPETNIDVKKGWGNVVKAINGADENSKINVDMGNSSTVPKNVMNAIKGKNIDIVLDMGDGITWTINGKDVTDPQSINLSVTKKKNSIPEDMISDPSNTIPLVLTHNGSFGCSATLSIDLKGNDKKVANLYYYNTKTKSLEFVDSDEIVNGKADLVFTHASDWAIVISDISAEYEDVSSAAGIYETDNNSQAPFCMIVIIIAVLGFSSIIITKRFAKNKH